MIKTGPLIGSDFPYAKRPDTGVDLLVRRSEDQFWTVVHCKSYKEKIYIYKSSTDSLPDDSGHSLRYGMKYANWGIHPVTIAQRRTCESCHKFLECAENGTDDAKPGLN
ncbi:hypothetical protein I6I68_00270 [Corynebacterium glucuronolyticum]|uniref:restriction endonuclease n=1 Tax=Corynebacterium glucuronolyticum TaxID=39791 RepID=UPI00191EF473|nr:hypothetical protein I6I68_00270 [Corynebacterium glucuronolyticum]